MVPESAEGGHAMTHYRGDPFSAVLAFALNVGLRTLVL